MRAARNHALSWLVTAVFALATTGGHSLHGLPGCGHGICSSERPGGCHSHREECGHREQAGTHDDRCGSVGLRADDCSICKFYGLGKILAGAWTGGNARPLCSAASVATADFYPAPSARGFDARGPPADRPDAIL